MVKKRKLKISDAVESLNALPVESPFGDTSVDSPRVLRPIDKLNRVKLKEELQILPHLDNAGLPSRKREDPDSEDLAFFDGLDATLIKKKKKKKKKKSVIDPTVMTMRGEMPLSEAIQQKKMEDEMFTEEDALRRKVKRLMTVKGYSEERAMRVALKQAKKKNTREVIMFPEKTNCESPKRSKLSKAPREVTKMQDKLSNIIRVPKEQLDTFMRVYNKSSKDLSSEFLASIAPVFLSYEDAMNYSTVALRDGLSYDGEIDLELSPLLEWSARLNTLELYLAQLTSLSDEVKIRIMRFATIKAVEKAFATKGMPAGLAGTHNKVAGIVTTLNNDGSTKKVKSAINSINQLKKAADNVKQSTVPGAILKKKRPMS